MKRLAHWAGCIMSAFGIFALGVVILLPTDVLYALVGKDQKVNSDGKVQFFIGKNHNLKPVYPVEFEINQEQGGVLDVGQVVTCDVLARSTPVIHNNEPAMITETAFRCGDNIFVIKRVIYTISPH